MPQNRSPIQLLPQSVINLIAAGEVAERPSIIVKELLENALDAGATLINLYLEDGGKALIELTDNGAGIPASELKLAVQRHTTSKIRNLDDLQKIKSFGFRGEALASIGSVAKVTITSKPAQQKTGAQVVVNHDAIGELQKASALTGTTVKVEELFAQVPARRKFLKSANSELTQILQIVSAAAMINPQVRFTVTHHQKVLLTLAATLNADDRIKDVWGWDEAHLLLPLEFAQADFALTGMLGKPQLARRSKNKQFLFINQRPVLDAQLSQIIKLAYGSLLEPRSEPAFVLNLQLPPELLDVNVHPRKEQVQFVEGSQVLEFVTKAVKSALQQRDLTYQPLANFGEVKVEDSQRQGSQSTGSLLKQAVETWQLGRPTASGPQILQIDRTYLVAASNNGVMLIDQHAAHERILYEQFTAALTQQLSAEKQTQLEPAVMIELTPTQLALLTEHQATLQSIGFEIEDFGANTIKINTVPSLLKDRPLAELLHELLEDLSAGHPVAEVDRLTHRTLAYLACRSAIKAGDFLPENHRRELLEKLSQTPNQFTCPHGRPTTIQMSIPELERLFKRR